MEHCGLCCNGAWHLEMPCLKSFQAVIQGVAKVFRTSLPPSTRGSPVVAKRAAAWFVGSFWNGGQNVAG